MIYWLERRLTAWLGLMARAFENNIIWLLFLNFSLLASFKFAPVFVLFICGLMVRRDALLAGWSIFTAAKMVWLPLVPLLIYPIVSLSYGGIPPGDDLLRHVTSWRHDYDYNNIYYNLREVIPHTSMWIAFEILAGRLDRSFGFWGAIFIIQTASYLCCAFICYKLAKFSLSGQPKSSSIEITIVVSLILLSGIFGRSMSARPEVFLTFWALSAFFVSARWWFFWGIFLMPAYWLSFIYIPAALLLRGGTKEKAISAALLFLLFAMFWSTYSGIEWVNNIVSAYTYSVGRLVPPGESGGVVYAFFSWLFILVLSSLVLYGKKSKFFDNLPIIIVIIWFMLPGQVRYIGILGPLVVVFVVRMLPNLNFDKSKAALAFLFSLSAIFISMPGENERLSNMPMFKLPPSAVVLTQFTVLAYSLPAMNPGIKISPGMEFGAFKPEVQKLIFDMENGSAPSCDRIKSLGYTHLIESSLGQISPCLRLIEINGFWRMWRVI